MILSAAGIWENLTPSDYLQAVERLVHVHRHGGRTEPDATVALSVSWRRRGFVLRSPFHLSRRRHSRCEAHPSHGLSNVFRLVGEAQERNRHSQERRDDVVPPDRKDDDGDATTKMDSTDAATNGQPSAEQERCQ